MKIEIVFLASWVIGILMCIFFTILAWKNKDKEMWKTLPYVWLGMILCGWVLGISILFLMLYVVFIRPRFEKL